ncbi:serine hydrolase [uncultured Meiothermus sp.]|jgi:CubicO group peptidase (beta-lactamase class C family)|uniref:serine hydrolase domain-containing protein n=1 Tax=uncultured Meiothermus sp. TaxID=157471 RepID=UPI00262C9CA7|nr:serine hydrolase [uncultured Meiothermus sp.]
MHRRTLLKGLAATLLVGSRGFAQNMPDPNHPNHHKLAAAYAAQHRGISLLVMVDGQTVFEDYPGSGSPTRAHELASGTKSFSGVMAVAAQQDGLLSLDEPLAETLPEWKSDPLRSQITLRQLLNLTSGIPGGAIARPPTYHAAIQTRAETPPGTRFSYGPIPFQIFGEVMRRNLRGDPLEYLKRRIFQPIGLEYAFWRRGADGNPHLPSGAFLTARNWARFGELVRQGGLWQGQRIVDATLLDKCLEPSSVNPIYGLTWWLGRPISPAQRAAIGRTGREMDALATTPGLPDDLAVAAGAGDQRLYISRKLRLVVVRQAEGIVDTLMGRGTNFSDATFLRLLLAGQG